MSENTQTTNETKKEKPKKKVKTTQEKIDDKQNELEQLIEDRYKESQKTPEQLFSNKVSDGVSRNWKQGSIPKESSLKTEVVNFATKDLTHSGIVQKSTKLMTLGLYLYKIETRANEILSEVKEKNPNLNEQQLEEESKKAYNQAKEGIDSEIAKNKKDYEASKPAPKPKADKPSESNPSTN